jgi:hypothetical protein
MLNGNKFPNNEMGIISQLGEFERNRTTQTIKIQENSDEAEQTLLSD